VEWDIEQLQESIDELIEKIEGEGCEETCAKYKAEVEELRAELEELLV
jgi:peptidoglycan hydrolase CwlO-like protein